MPSENNIKLPSTESTASDKIPGLPPTDNDEDATSNPTTTTATEPPKAYVYRDYAQDNTDYGGEAEMTVVDGRGLTNQKLPAKLNAMLSDPDLVTCITWMPHGRSWKILNRDVFSRFALPKYFGHTNHASFIRIVNAWGFRRVVATGPDRDTYYHELFLRGKHNLHVKMKRLPTTHRKTPLDKNESSPNFYELSEKSPLPENVWLSQGGVVGRGGMVMGSQSSQSQQQQQMGMMEGYAGMMGGGMGGGLGTMSGMNMNSTMQQMMQQQQQQQQMMGHSMSRMMPGMGMMSATAPFAYPPVNPAAASAAAMSGGGGTTSSSSAVASIPPTMGKHLAENETLLQLQRENDTLMRQLLQLQNQMNPQTNVSTSAENNAAVTALQRDNELLIRQVMELQEQLPQELRMTVPVEMLGTSSTQEQKKKKKVVEGKSEEKSDDVLEKV